jgi:hypothetical protein
MIRPALKMPIVTLTFLCGVASHRLVHPNRTKVRASETPVVAKIRYAMPPASPSPTPSETYTNQLLFDYDRKTFDPTGSYYVIGNVAEFSEFESIELWPVHVDAKPNSAFIGVAFATVGQRVEPVVFGVVTRHRLIFKTRSPYEEDVEYDFDGEFLRGKIVYEAPSGRAVLRGRLTKSKNGRTIAERIIKFRVEYHGC